MPRVTHEMKMLATIEYDSLEVQQALRDEGVKLVEEFMQEIKKEFDAGALTDIEANDLIAQHAFNAALFYAMVQLLKEFPFLTALATLGLEVD